MSLPKIVKVTLLLNLLAFPVLAADGGSGNEEKSCVNAVLGADLEAIGRCLLGSNYGPNWPPWG
jgi:hypothetical protein